MLKVFEFTKPGFDRRNERPDDVVVWIAATSRSEVLAALPDGHNCDVLDIELDALPEITIDYWLPQDERKLGEDYYQMLKVAQAAPEASS